jgi:hypothetical protein
MNQDEKQSSELDGAACGRLDALVRFNCLLFDIEAEIMPKNKEHHCSKYKYCHPYKDFTDRFIIPALYYVGGMITIMMFDGIGLFQ